jgi:hypothetical protein
MQEVSIISNSIDLISVSSFDSFDLILVHYPQLDVTHCVGSITRHLTSFGRDLLLVINETRSISVMID